MRCDSPCRSCQISDERLRFSQWGPALVLWGCVSCTVAQVAAATDSNGSLFRLFARPAAAVPNTTPHPAIVRVIVEEGKALANGSGSLVAVREQYGLVVTNWHVVREATGKIEVVFPDGFRSAATVLKTDEDWDLAALLVWRTSVVPLTISTQAPQPGDVLTIAGYGPGDYRAVSGKCTQYVAPSEKHPFEIVELSAQARQGDSGGPILNARGELAGVLFGANRGSTSGTYCARVRLFLTSVWPDLDSPTATANVTTPLVAFDASKSLSAAPPANDVPLVPVAPEANTAVSTDLPVTTPFEPPIAPIAVINTPPPLPTARPTAALNWDAVFGDTNWDRSKTVLAIIGLLTVWGHVARMLTK